MMPRQLEALEALGMIDDVIDRMLIMEAEVQDDTAVLNVEWTDITLEVILDSGCTDHVMDVEREAPGYDIVDSPGSRQGRGFTVGNGERVDNEGQSALVLESSTRPGETQQFVSTFQAARITKPLMSVAKICSNGFRCIFDEKQAKIVDTDDNVACIFEKRGGLYVSSMKLKAPPPFTGPA